MTTLLSILEESEKQGKDIEEIIKIVNENMDYEAFTGDMLIRQVHRSVLKKLEH